MKERLFSVFYMFVLTFCCTSMVSAVKYFNDHRIERNQRVKLERLVLKVLEINIAGIDDEAVEQTFRENVKSLKMGGRTVYAGFENKGRTLRGYAFPVSGPGFWGPIYAMVGVDPGASSILGLAFYRHSETPGLGGRMTEPWFTDQFKGLKLGPYAKEETAFSLMQQGVEKKAGELDAITGATQTSRAIEAFLNRELSFIAKHIQAESE